MSLESLYETAIKVSDTRRFYAASKTRRITNVIPYEPQSAVLFQWESQGISVAALHQINLFFWGLEVTKEKRDHKTHLELA